MLLGQKGTDLSDLQWPALSGGDSEEREESPEDVVVVKLVLLPLSGLSRHIVLIVIQKLAPGKKHKKPLSTLETWAFIYSPLV